MKQYGEHIYLLQEIKKSPHLFDTRPNCNSITLVGILDHLQLKIGVRPADVDVV